MGPFRTVKDFLFANRKNYLLGIFWVIFVDSLQLVIPKILGSFAEEFSLNQLTTSRRNAAIFCHRMASGVICG